MTPFWKYAKDLVIPLVVAAIVGAFAMYGTVSKMDGQFQIVLKQLTTMDDKLDKHIQNYSIHIPHGR